MSGNGLVLVADDDEDILMLVRLILERAGFEVIAARDGAEAVELACARPPQLVVLDVTMPEVDGLEALERLRADERTAGVPVLLLSSRVQEADVERGLAAGATGYVPKPFSPRDLTARVAELLTPG